MAKTQSRRTTVLSLLIGTLLLLSIATVLATENTCGIDLEQNIDPVYRFWSPVTGSHFFTTSIQEKDKLLENYSEVWTPEGIAFYVYSNKTEETSPVYRFWSPVTGSHFYTISEQERDKLLENYTDFWTPEGIAFHVYEEETKNTVPVYRFWSPVTGSHFYTISEQERDKLLENYSEVWTPEGIAFYVYNGTCIPIEDHDKDNDGYTDNDECIGHRDCNDNDPNVHPGAIEICGDGIDNDCSDGDKVCDVDEDEDNDGYNKNEDCNDNDPSVHPGATEICGDGIDNDCDGYDDSCVNEDEDNDGYNKDEDCNDHDASINPGATEICGDGIDNDCSNGDQVCEIEDTTPSASISGLMSDVGTSWIRWDWTNPSDSDFHQNLIFIDGVSTLNTSNDFYKIIVLGENITHTITIYTMDNSSNINWAGISSTATTSTSSDDDDDDDDDSHSHGGGDYSTDNEPVIFYGSDVIDLSTVSIDAPKAVKLAGKTIQTGFNWALFWVMMLIIGILIVMTAIVKIKSN